MRINYNDWFYDYHRYLKGTKDGNTSYNDTNWVDIGKRYQTLIDTNSHLLREQPYAVVGNNLAFDKLLDLLERSNYTFDDINDAFIKTYEHTLRGAMSRMLVNTHNVLIHYKNTDHEHVYVDKLTQCYVIEVPFAQMHFGERDEFIRQKLSKMHSTENDLYLSLDEFMTDEVVDILGFTIICTANGYICNDCYVAMSEKGLRFKIRWNHSEDADFIIYKLDESYVCKAEVNVESLKDADVISTTQFPDQIGMHIGEKCLLNIYDANYKESILSIPNFGELTSSGLVIHNLQPKTLDMLENYGTRNATVVVYFIKYLHEVSNVYPAINYYDVMDRKRVLSDKHNGVVTDNGRVLMQNDHNINALEVCTPPICIDRKNDASFNTLTMCLSLYRVLMDQKEYIDSIVKWYTNPNANVATIDTDVKDPALDWVENVYDYYEAYHKCAIITSIIPTDTLDRFKDMMDVMSDIGHMETIDEIDQYRAVEDLFYYDTFVYDVFEPFINTRLEHLTNLQSIGVNYYDDTTPFRFNRPVSEQSFLTLRYDTDEECWLFSDPKIQPFRGIGNTFYINDDLNGDEVFKFFVLYSDTEAPSETTTDDTFTENLVLDFDLFSHEVEKHLGFIRYWDAENKLMKLSHIMLQEYSEDTTIQILSKMLKRKLEGHDLLDEYASDMIYTTATMTSSNIDATDTELEAPFAINYLFYTLALLQGNEDKLEAYFYQQLTNDKFHSRYVDLDVFKALHENGEYPVNFSRISRFPIMVDNTSHMMDDGYVHMYYGLPILFRNTENVNDTNAYRYTFNVYGNGMKYPLIGNHNDLDTEHYVSYMNVNGCGYLQYDYSTDIAVARCLSLYLCSLRDCINTIQTNYTSSFNQTSTLQNAIERVQKHIEELRDVVRGKAFIHADTQSIVDSVINDNPMIAIFENMIQGIQNCIVSNNLYGAKKNIFDNVNNYLQILQKTYQQTGFDQMALKRIRKLYVTMKRINSPMTLVEYEVWLNEIDDGYISKEIGAAVSDNPNVVNPSLDFDAYGSAFVFAKYNTIIPGINALKAMYQTLEALKTSHLSPIESYCADIVNHYVFDLYAIDDIKLTEQSFVYRPAFVILTITNDNHTLLQGTSGTGTVSLMFIPSVSKDGEQYTITDLRSAAEYAFFNGETLQSNQISAYAFTSSKTTIGSLNIDHISFTRVGSSGDTTDDFYQIPSVCNTKVDIQNIHETFEMRNNQIVNTKYGVMNYEMLYGNRFTTLDHIPMLVTQPRVSALQGPIDRIYISNEKINHMAFTEYGHRTSDRMYFKPSQILHMPIDALDRVTSFGGKNFVGQRVYLATKDTKYIFPVKVTSIDHSQSRGILEARVESRDVKWLQLADANMIERYLTSDIACTVVPDNISNFLNEFSNEDYNVYWNPEYDQSLDPSDSVYSDMYSLPGDPIFVQNNADFVYTRLSHFFHELVPNRFIDDEHKKWRFIYMGCRDTRYEDENGYINGVLVQTLKHNFNTLTDPEMYPILREEPNDHGVYHEENEVFSEEFLNSLNDVTKYNNLINQYRVDLNNAQTEYDRQQISDKIHTTRVKLNMAYEKAHKLQYWMEQPETPSTWYNVYSHDAAAVYMENGRANLNKTFVEDIRDIPYFKALQVFLYDWEKHEWVDPSTYQFDSTSTANYGIDYFSDTDNPDAFVTSDVLKHLTIYTLSGFPRSKRLLIYFAYDTSKFDNPDRQDLSPDCNVRFKPVLSLNRDAMNIDPYAKLYVRKHFDVNEVYRYDAYNTPSNFNGNGYHVIRNRRSGKDVYSPTVRLCDVSVTNHDLTQQFDLYIRIPFDDVRTSQTFKTPTYQVLQYQTMDDFVPNQRVKFICIQNKSNVKYDGNISSIMFEGITGNTENDTIQITSSSLPSYVEGNFVCCTLMDPSYKCKGGIYTIQVSTQEQNLINGSWVQIPRSIGMYKELPDEFLIVPSNALSGVTTITLNGTYDKHTTNSLDPFMYYFDTTNDVRLPISNVQRNDHQTRLTIDQTEHADIDLIKTNYIGICRYSINNIPEDGFIDVSGFIPTPLSRERYEWWVNGRYIKDPEDLVILSPTSFQLRNLKSLHNFELIELVDDTGDNDLVKHDVVYMGIDGTAYSSYERALLSKKDITQQDIRYTFNSYPNHTKLQDYIGDMLPDPKNRDVEPNILEGLVTDTLNVPSINGVSLYHVTTEQLGLCETPFQDILDVYDKTWKKEILTNPLFPTTHADSSWINRSFNQLRVKRDGDMYRILIKGIYDKYQTLYISKTETGEIDDTPNTLKIIPFIKNGTIIHIDQKYHGMWIHSTNKTYKPIIIK